MESILDTVMGVPLHPLFVHGAVVLFPMIVAGIIAVAWKPAWREAYSRYAIYAALGGFLIIFLTAQAGEALEERVRTESAHEHAEMGEAMVPAALIMVVATVALHWATAKSESLRKITAVAVSVIGVGAVLWLIAVGHSGAESVWSNLIESTNNLPERDHD